MNTDDMTFEQLCELFNYTPKGRPLSTEEAAAILQCSKVTLEVWRGTGCGPRYFRPRGTRRVLYSERDILAFIASGARKNTSDQHAAA